MKKAVNNPLTFERVTRHQIRLRRVLPACGLIHDREQEDGQTAGHPLQVRWPFILVEYKRIPPGHFYPMHRHDRGVHEFYFVNRGTVDISLRGNHALVLRPGYATIFPPGPRHSMSSASGAAVINVHFPLDRREPWTTAMKGLSCRAFELPAFCRAALQLLVQIEDFPKQAQPALSSGLLGAILLTASREGLPSGERSDHLLEGMTGYGIAGRAIECIVGRNGHRQTVGQIARRIGVGRRTLEIAFRRQTGMTVHQASLKLRLRRARKLLVTGELSVKQVAFDSGFRDAGSFSRAFRRLHGFTPGEIAQGNPTGRKNGTVARRLSTCR